MATSTLPTTNNKAVVTMNSLQQQQQQQSEQPRPTYSGSITNNSNANARGNSTYINCTAHSHVPPPSSTNATIAKEKSITNRNSTKEGRLKDLKLMEYYLNQHELSRAGGTTLTTAVSAEDDSGNCVETNDTNVNFDTRELLQQHLLRQHHTNDDDDRLINQILFQSTGIAGITAAPTASQLLHSHASITSTDSTKTFLLSLPKMSSYSRCSSITVPNDNTLLDSTSFNTIFNSSAWKPTLQSDHQEIRYAPEQIFESTAISRGIAATSPYVPTNPYLAVEAATAKTEPLSAGAETLLLAAQVLHDKNSKSSVSGDKLNKLDSAVTEKKPRARKASNQRSLHEHTINSSRCRDNSNKNNVNAATHIPILAKPTGEQIPFKLIPGSEITNNDVLLGRGGRTNHHVGNATYRKYKEELQERYLTATKDEKTDIANELVEMIHSRNGRFLKEYDPTKPSAFTLTLNQTADIERNRKAKLSTKKKGNNNDDEDDDQSIVDYWYEVDLKAARTKASQALRELNTPEIRAAKRAKYRNK
jgi:hypothetical protein